MRLENIAGSRGYHQYREEQKRAFWGKQSDEEKTIELSSRYKVRSKNFHTEYSSPSYGIVDVLDETDEVIYSYDNICPHYEFHKLIKHSDGHCYYIFRIDSQGYSVLNLETSQVEHYVPQNHLLPLSLLHCRPHNAMGGFRRKTFSPSKCEFFNAKLII